MATTPEGRRPTLADLDLDLLSDALVSSLVRKGEAQALCSFWSCSNKPGAELEAEAPMQPPA